MLIYLERYPEALEVANQVLEKNPISWAYHLQGLAYAEQEELDKALDDLLDSLFRESQRVNIGLFSPFKII
jgi:tetratricopeptide (TPR) repeat protein